MKIGPYEVLGTLGRGGMGVVYRARSPGGEEVALKILGRLEADGIARFDRERRLLGGLGVEDGFVPLLDAGESAQGPWIVMPLVTGGTLRERLRGGPLGVEGTLEVGRALAGALAKAHERGIVHRDLKPENVLYHEGRPLLADLGLAKHFDRSTPGASQTVSLSVDGSSRGTAGYMPPEQMRDAKSVGPPADVFALGAILLECLAGRPAFPGKNALEVVVRVTDGKHEKLRPE
ncbi:MAG TPA: serine/threonine-protein kinase, partial [Planctomycetota bacterium]|nr:serine/threonine-protein kinase [Planctomycetota bacterium]